MSITQETVVFLTEILGTDRVSTRKADLDAHAQGESFHDPHPREVVA